MNNITIKNATEEQLKDMQSQINERLAEMAKPKQYVFKDGDISLYGNINMYSNEWIKWVGSFSFLAYHCLKLGGRVMSKPNDEKDWIYSYYSFLQKKWLGSAFSHTTGQMFWLPNTKLHEQFLSTEGVRDHLYNFFQIER